MIRLLLALCLFPSVVFGASARERLLISPEALEARLEDPSLVVLHIGPEEGYAEAHVPGARFVDSEDFTVDVPNGPQFQFPEPEAVVAFLEANGVGDDSFVVVCFDGRWVTASTRLMLTLHWIGLGERSALLDGGMNRWKAEGRPVTSDVPAPARGRLTARVHDDMVVDAAWVDAHRGKTGYRLVDARAVIHYDGTEATSLNGVPVRKGHIPGAGNLPFTEIVDENLCVRSDDELRALFEAAGYEEGETIVAYCHLGLFATLVVHAARTLDLPFVFYDGSFQDWGSREDLPVENPSEDATGR